MLRPTGESVEGAPFPGWSYQPAWLPDGLSIWIGETGIEEPMLVYMPFARNEDWAGRVVPHPLGVDEISAVTIGCPQECSPAALRCLPQGVSLAASPDYALTIEFDGGHAGESLDLRPKMPLILKR